jgi:nicotinamide-nucleotide amidase
MIDLKPLRADVQALIDRCHRENLRLATAESCTGGLIAAAITDLPGSSAMFDRGYVTYSNEAKSQMIDVPPAVIEAHGAVSEETAVAMAEGALARSGVDITVAVTGIAGPGGGTSEKPVGMVCFAAARRGHATVRLTHVFADLGRDSIRLASTTEGLRLLMQMAFA